jgi:hypothetical protein
VSDDQEVETINDCGVSASSDGILLLMPCARMSNEKALRFAAYLVAPVGDKERFELIYRAVCST